MTQTPVMPKGNHQAYWSVKSATTPRILLRLRARRANCSAVARAYRVESHHCDPMGIMIATAEDGEVVGVGSTEGDGEGWGGGGAGGCGGGADPLTARLGTASVQVTITQRMKKRRW